MENKELLEQKPELLNGLNDEQKEKAKECKTMDELMSLLSEYGVALPDDMFDNIAGGVGIVKTTSPTNVKTKTANERLSKAREIYVNENVKRDKIMNESVVLGSEKKALASEVK